MHHRTSIALAFYTSRVTPTPADEWARRVLGVKPGATQAQLKDAYRAAAIKSHPDRHPPAMKAEAARKFRRCSEAYAILRTISDANTHVRGEDGGRASSGAEGRYGSWASTDAERLFKETFGGLSDAEILQAAIDNRVGAASGMGVISLRRIQRQISKVSPVGPGGHVVDTSRWPWRPDA
jgi:DnaJ-class molecular chaperone